MRVALVGDCPLDPGELKNGPQAVFTYLLEGLRQYPDLNIHVVTAQRSLNQASTFQRDRVTFHYLPYPPFPAELSFPILCRRVHRVLHAIEPELVHGQSGHRYGAMCLSAGYPTVLTPHNIHGTQVPYAPSVLSRLRLRLHFALSRRYFVANVRHVVSISPHVRRSFEPLTQAAFYDIDNPISNAFFRLDPEHEVPYQILFVSPIRTIKRPDRALAVLASAVKQEPELCLHFAGARAEMALYREMQGFIAEHHLVDNVRFLGHLNQARILECYQNSSIFLLTSDLETAPIALEQALAAGKPAVVTDVGGTRYLVDHGRNGYVIERNNTAGLVDAVVRLARDDALRKEFGRQARQSALTRFRSEVVAAKVYDMYQQILGSAGQ